MDYVSVGGDDGVEAPSLSAFLAGVALLIDSDLFASSTSGDVRIHFRILVDQSYDKYIVWRGGRLVEDKLTPIPAGEKSLIDRSYELRRSIVASADAEHVFETGSDWGDFLTYSFRGIGENNGRPLLTMGVSLRYSDQYQDSLYLLCHCRFERTIQHCVDTFHKAFDVSKMMQADVSGRDYIGDVRK